MAEVTKKARKVPVTVLNYLNRLRGTLNLSPLSEVPKGKINQASKCPVAKALNGRVFVDGDGIGFTSKDALLVVKNPTFRPFMLDDVLSVPHYVEDFISRFDQGEYPQLVN